jgi:hypothetical protein
MLRKLVLKMLDNISVNLCVSNRFKIDTKIKLLKLIRKYYKKVYYIGA